MLYKIVDLSFKTVAFVSPKALVSYHKKLYIHFDAKASLAPDLLTGRTVRIVKLDSKALVDFSTIPKNIRVVVMDDYPILSVGFKPTLFGDIIIEYRN